MPTTDSTAPDWPEALATVLSCTYTPRLGRAIAFGLPASQHFHITCNYWAEGSLHTTAFYAAKPIPQGSLFPIRYNPVDPNTIHHAGRTKGSRVHSASEDSKATPGPDWTSRFALAALVGFFAGLLTLPVACTGINLLNEHRYGDIQSGGPTPILGGMAIGALTGLAVALLLWNKSRPR